jgi:RNA 2',3'-cyclic 3'-phosphodiesterase
MSLAMHRLFVAIRPPAQVRDLLIDSMDESPALGWVGEDNLHLTLRFVGEVERPVANDLAQALQRIAFPAFNLEIRGVGRFERRNGGALWAGIEPRKPVADLAAKVERACQSAGLGPERRVFHPHITLARYKSRNAGAARDFERRKSGLSSEPFRVDRFTLFESHLSRHGAYYEEVSTYRLGQ